MHDARGEKLALTTVSTLEQAEALARAVLDKRLAACITCLPGAVSFFRWQSEEITRESEIVLLIKTHERALSALQALFRTAHPYECPELVVLDVSALSEDYRAWLHAEMRLPSNPPSHVSDSHEGKNP